MSANTFFVTVTMEMTGDDYNEVRRTANEIVDELADGFRVNDARVESVEESELE